MGWPCFGQSHKTSHLFQFLTMTEGLGARAWNLWHRNFTSPQVKHKHITLPLIYNLGEEAPVKSHLLYGKNKIPPTATW